jgi:hypothetical protein
MDQSYFVRAICGDIVGTCSAPRNLKPKATRQISNWAQLRGAITTANAPKLCAGRVLSVSDGSLAIARLLHPISWAIWKQRGSVPIELEEDAVGRANKNHIAIPYLLSMRLVSFEPSKSLQY